MKVSQFTTTIDQGCGWALGIHFRKPDGSAFDLSRGVTTFQMRGNAQRSNAPRAVPTANPISPAAGDCIYSLSSAKTAALPSPGAKFSVTQEIAAEIDFAYSDDPKNPQRIAEGRIFVSPGGNVTPDPNATDPKVAPEWITIIVYGDHSVMLDGGDAFSIDNGIAIDGGSSNV